MGHRTADMSFLWQVLGINTNTFHVTFSSTFRKIDQEVRKQHKLTPTYHMTKTLYIYIYIQVILTQVFFFLIHKFFGISVQSI